MALIIIRSTRAPNSDSAAPSWFTNATAGRWEEIPGTALGTPIAGGDGFGANALAYSGMGVDQTSRKLYMVTGGHALHSNNKIISLDLAQESCAWTSEMVGSSDTTGDFSTNGTGAYTDGSRVSDHAYSATVAGPSGSVYLPVIGSGWGPSSTTFVSSACWKWRAADIGNGEQGFSYLGKAHNDITGMSLVESVGCYDSSSGLVWCVSQNAFQTPNPVWSIDTATDVIATYGGYSGYLEYPVWAAVVPRLNVLLVGTDANTVKRMDLSTKAWANCTVTGTGIANRTDHAAYCTVADQVIGRLNGDGNSLRVLTLPALVNGTYAWDTVAAVAGGVSPGDVNQSSDAGPYSRVNVMQDMGNGEAALVYAKGGAEPTYVYRIAGPL